MTLPEETRLPSPASLESCQGSDPGHLDDLDNKHQWDINDTNLPVVPEHEDFKDWPNGHCKHVYLEESEEARRHSSGWAMRNTNNHNVNILKKSCLGVLVCSRRCTMDNGQKIHMRPAICDKARKKQLGKACPNPRCDGRLEMQPCRGHCGYPVTHFWRHINGYIFFQAKGVHDHSQPDVKNYTESRRHPYNTKENRHTVYERRSRKRPLYSSEPSYPSAKVQRLNHMDHLVTPVKQDLICSCPPFECVCGQAMSQTLPSHFVSPQPTAYVNPAASTCAYSTPSSTGNPSFIQMPDFTFFPSDVKAPSSYSEYFDFGTDCILNSNQQQRYTKPTVHVAESYNTSQLYHKPSEYQVNGYSNGLSSCSLSNRQVVSRPTTDSCMYPSSQNLLVDPSVSYSSCSYQSDTTSPCAGSHLLNASHSQESDSGFLSSCGHGSPALSTGSAAVCGVDHRAPGSSTSFDDFDLTNPADILSLDQPINKEAYSNSSVMSAKDKSAVLSGQLDLSALLPSITSFLDENSEGASKQAVSAARSLNQYLLSPEEHSRRSQQDQARAVMTSSPTYNNSSPPPCRESPHLLTELQPIHQQQQQQQLDMIREKPAISQKTIIQNHFHYVRGGDVFQYYSQLPSGHNPTAKQQMLPETKPAQSQEPLDCFSFYNGDIYQSSPSTAYTGQLVNCS